MKYLTTLLASAILVAAGCEVEQTESGEAPEIEIEPGQVPEYSVNWAEVDVGTTQRTVTVPRLVVVQEEETVEVPFIDVTSPGDASERRERTLTVETEVPHPGYNLRIRNVVAADDRIFVVAELRETDAQAPAQRVRISDRVVIRAPDAEIEYYVIGDRPEGGFNEDIEYVASEAELPQEVRSGRQLYTVQ